MRACAVATVEARCIEQTGATIPSISDAANRWPRLRHVGPPPPASGYSMKYFEVRRYGVTGTSSTGNITRPGRGLESFQ